MLVLRYIVSYRIDLYEKFENSSYDGLPDCYIFMKKVIFEEVVVTKTVLLKIFANASRTHLNIQVFRYTLRHLGKST